MSRIAIDTNIIDLIASTTGLLPAIQAVFSKSGSTFVVVHIIDDQLAEIPDPAKRNRLQEVYRALPKDEVPTSEFVLDVSKLDRACLGEDAGPLLTEMTTKGRGGMHDALIALTAQRKADILVTEDGELRKKVTGAAPAFPVWTFKEFHTFVESTSRG